MAGIFINYRRDDAPGVAGRLFDYLALKFPRRSLFMDVDAMKPGMDFAEQLDTQVSQCRVLLAVIGPRWLDAKDQAGHRRLDSEKDYVRIELASALKREIPVIPVLVDGAVMPSEDRLADDLKPLARRHALELRHTRFNADADAIVHALESVVPRSRVPRKLVAAAVVVVAGIAVLAVSWPKLSATLRSGAPPPTVVAAKPPAPNPPAIIPAGKPPAPVSPAPSNTSVPAASSTPAQPAAPAPVNAVTPDGLPAGVTLGEMMHGITMPGSNFRYIDILPDDPASCQAACRGEPHCAAWSYAQPRMPGQAGRCGLKQLIPEQVANICCVAAVERAADPELREPPPVPADMTGVLRGIDLFGADLRSFVGAQATPEACQAACRAEGLCLGWTYERPGAETADARCWLKNRLPSQIHSACCISGIERQAAVSPAPAVATSAPAANNGALVNTDLRGSSYRNFEMSADTWPLCQSACKADNQCLAWTSVHPGLQGPNARCWLKNKIPSPTANSCCTSGIERPDVH
jgi:hypothetical protein